MKVGFSDGLYAYDKAGNLIQSADQRSGVLHYVYDKIGRIQEARNSQSGRSETFAFDPAHNILDIPTSTPSPVGEGKTTAPISDTPQTQGRLKSPANPNLTGGNRLKEYNGIEYTYDALGNLIYRQLPNGENQYYQYDLENQLVRAEIKKPAGNTEIWTYAYDPFGRRLSKERQDKLAWTSTDPKRTHFVWDGSRLLKEYTYKGSYTYLYTDQDSYEPLAQIFDNAKDSKQYLAYFHNDQIGIPREMTDIHGNLLWYGEYTAWGRLKKDGRVYQNVHQPFRLQNQYFDEETGLHYNLMRYYEPEAGRFVNQDPIGLWGGESLYWFAPNSQIWIDPFGLVHEKTPGYHVYGLFDVDSNTGKIADKPYYVGITNDTARRIAEHQDTGRLTKDGLTRMEPLHRNLTYGQARGYEQALIEHYDTKHGEVGKEISQSNRQNKINSFDINSKTRRKSRQKYFMKFRNKLLKKLKGKCNG
ncbi:RHS repeat-associated core domain-containing protein [Neisseria lactamica]|uniref:RHS repeat-associated core domain-containing protein n=1 Tax=Neisseria lactamica TaxID=486 RepID=UPI003556FB95